MSQDPRWDPEMLEVTAALAAAAAVYPPVTLSFPLEPQRAINDRMGIEVVGPGPELPQVEDRWIPARGRRIQCRLYRPTASADLPVLVFFHGGGWVWSSIDTHDRLAREIALAGQVAVLSVDYALSPEARFPQALEECALVIRHLAAHPADWPVDTGRIGVAGDSAGGNLALATALLLRDTGGPALKATVAGYPITDSDLTRPSYNEFADGYGLTKARMQEFWDAYVSHPADRLNPLAAPLKGNLAHLPPTLILLAELDVLKDEGQALHEKLTAASVPTTCHTYKGVAHGFLRHTARLTQARTALRALGDWLRVSL